MIIPQARAAVNWLKRLVALARPAVTAPDLALALVRPGLSELAQPGTQLPTWVAQCAVAGKYLTLLGPLDWRHFPERPSDRPWPGPPPSPRAPFVAAYLVKLHEGKRYMSELRDYLGEHPALVWLLGFPLEPCAQSPWGFDVQASLPTARHFGRVLRTLPNEALQFLLDSTVQLLRQELPPELEFGQAISLDVKHILAWVRENNPKAYVTEHDRLTKTRQPNGDRDCRLGCKHKRNASAEEVRTEPAHPPTPTKNPVPVTNFSSCDLYYWGYATGVAATKVPDWGEFVLAELTQTFDRADPTYFFPVMAQVERRLGFRPPFGAFDAAFDPFYVFVRRLTTA